MDRTHRGGKVSLTVERENNGTVMRPWRITVGDCGLQVTINVDLSDMLRILDRASVERESSYPDGEPITDMVALGASGVRRHETR